MQARTKAVLRREKSVRQSVTIPAGLAAQLRKVAKERHLTMSGAMVSLAEQGIRAERQAKENLRGAYRRFMEEREPARKEAAGKDLVRAIFGTDAVAEDTLL
jgi:hypothetical protein